MRFIFSDMSRPERAAGKLRDYLRTTGRLIPLTFCQRAVAAASGYRDWAELRKCIDPQGGHPIDENSEDKFAVLRKVWQKAAFAQEFYLSDTEAEAAFNAVRLTGTYRTAVKTVQPEEISPPVAVTPSIAEIWIMEWEESERGWGTRPDGYSVHPSEAASRKWLADYWERMKEYDRQQGYGTGYVPDEYSRPYGDAFPLRVSSDHKLVTDMGANGYRVWRSFSEGALYGEIVNLTREQNSGNRIVLSGI